MENYQFIEGVNNRLGSATAYCRSRPGRRHFARHFREEYDHGEFFIQGLLALGFSRDAITPRARSPARGASSITCGDARGRSSLFYAACSGFLESTGGDRSNRARVLRRRDGTLCQRPAGDRLPARRPPGTGRGIRPRWRDARERRPLISGPISHAGKRGPAGGRALVGACSSSVLRHRARTD